MYLVFRDDAASPLDPVRSSGCGQWCGNGVNLREPMDVMLLFTCLKYHMAQSPGL